MRAGPPPDAAPVLATLKDFQRRTVDYVFRRLYEDADFTKRFLVADEVGLGKTLVARGVIAKTIAHLWHKVDRIDVVYICSNADIAAQNIKRLRPDIEGVENFVLPTRLTLLPTKVEGLKGREVNLISLTPGTSFDPKSSMGTAEERALLYWLLKDAWKLPSTRGPLNVLQGGAGKKNFRDLVQRFRRERQIDRDLAASFREALAGRVRREREAGERDIRKRFLDLCRRFARSRKHIPDEDRTERAKIIGELRAQLAATCIDALEPDLVIMDEFQRFRHLLSGDNEASQLARSLFESSVDESGGARVLLLSATPYKMYTRFEEDEDEDHYADFIKTVRFLLDDEDRLQQLNGALERFRENLLRAGVSPDESLAGMRKAKSELEGSLRKVMVRTERLASSTTRAGMLVDVPSGALPEPSEILRYVRLQDVANGLGHQDVMEYWKAAPYLLNFMEDYELKKLFTEALNNGDDAGRAYRKHGKELFFPWDAWREYGEVDPENARLRSLQSDVIDSGAWRLLWVPPTLPYYELGGPFAGEKARAFTKRLLFSAWRVVPKVVATLLSYEAERQMMLSFNDTERNRAEDRARHRQLLRFTVEDGRVTGMPVLGMMYPSTVLARECDPLLLSQTVARRHGEWPPSLVEVRQEAATRIVSLLADLPVEHAGGPSDEAWYWAAPILLDCHLDTSAREWLTDPNVARLWSPSSGLDGEDDASSIWRAHISEAIRLAEGQRRLTGPPPADLPEVLADLALAGPGVCLYRALSRVAGAAVRSDDDNSLKNSAAVATGAFLSLFNRPEVMALIRGQNQGEPYWRRVLKYCAEGGLQAVLDEYAHVLRESLGLFSASPEDVTAGIATAIGQAVSLRAVTLRADEIHPGRKKHTESKGMRARFALRYGDERDDERTLMRSGQVRDAFNSPFWPFVLASTSIGQEGLDFHQYCHAIVHWDLPSNPVDLEQREGRIHRYKGHAIRKNLASTFGEDVLLKTNEETSSGATLGDPWRRIFDRGVEARAPGEDDVVPYWVFTQGGARIERHVPAIPLSREVARLARLKRSLALYRMIFGQPRQEDLMAYLLTHMDSESAERIAGELRMDLSPPSLEYSVPEKMEAANVAIISENRRTKRL